MKEPAEAIILQCAPHVIATFFDNMADEQSKPSETKEVSSVKKHHKQTSLSYSRPKYREARWERAVKVCTLKFETF